ncbi:MAG TPA: nicotinate-nicotinamide nucleotide adenylyltransferase [Blastocatellia bacterium]|nr:nicotinate-nicotinamide nucleotide adenylyltransferase [Blastocatellia bacterium]
MERGQIQEIISRVAASPDPFVEIVKRAQETGERVGVFASSFNPVTIAHAELMKRAGEQFSLDETLALAGVANADKQLYEAPLADRVLMLTACFAGDPRVSVGLSSHAFFVDMLDALRALRGSATRLHFILGFDTFERVLDRENRYTAKYQRRFKDRLEALEFLVGGSRLIVGGRAGAGHEDFRRFIEREPPLVAAGVSFLDFPADLAEFSATEVRNRARRGVPISGLVPVEVERYINEHSLYRPSDADPGSRRSS